MQQTVEDWAANGDCNVCAIDWSALAGDELLDVINYSKVAMHYTRLASNAIIQFMSFLQQHGMNIEEVSMAGHSLGAHIAGFVGQHFDGKINAIYGILSRNSLFNRPHIAHYLLFCFFFLGLDPAGPTFEKLGIDSKLDASDAKYVQCIYTDGDTFGTKTRYGDGHANFIMNEGENQPGCFTAICDHARAYKYFTVALSKNYKFEGRECRTNHILTLMILMDGKNLNLGFIKDQIGIHSKREKGTFCVKTKSKSPYVQAAHQEW